MKNIDNFLWDKIYNGRQSAERCWKTALENGYVNIKDQRAFFKRHAELEQLYQERYGNIIPESNMKRKVKVNESQLKNIVSNAIMEALSFERTVDKNNPKGNVGPKDSNLNFFVTIGSGSNRKIVGDKGFKTREAAERKAKSLRDQGKTGVSIISKKVVEEAYSTPPSDDLAKYLNLHFGSSDGETMYANGRRDNIGTQIDRVCKGLSAVMHETYSDSGKYSKKIYELVSKAYYIANMWKKQEMAKTGIQPDINYDERHRKTDYSFMNDPTYMESREKTYGA